MRRLARAIKRSQKKVFELMFERGYLKKEITLEGMGKDGTETRTIASEGPMLFYWKPFDQDYPVVCVKKLNDGKVALIVIKYSDSSTWRVFPETHMVVKTMQRADEYYLEQLRRTIRAITA